MNKKRRFFVMLLAVMLCMAAFSTVAYAAEGDDAFTPDGTGTVVDNATDEDGKEFYTIVTPDGHVFYLIIDRQRSEKNVYFLDAVTEKDLLPLTKIESTAPTVSSEPTAQQTEKAEQNTNDQSKQTSSTGGIIVAVLIIAVIAGTVLYFFKFRKKKKDKRKAALDEYDFDEDEDKPDAIEEDAEERETEDEEP